MWLVRKIIVMCNIGIQLYASSRNFITIKQKCINTTSPFSLKNNFILKPIALSDILFGKTS